MTNGLQIFFSGATQYYVTGRCAVLAGQIPVAGNLLHHAIEMYVKGGLAKTMTMKEMKALSHKLPDLWAAFKARFADTVLSSFDGLVSSLHAFEELRYPDSILAKGMAVTMGVTRGPAPAPSGIARPEPTYELYLDEIDALVGKIFQVVSVNPAFFLDGLSHRAREYLKEGNVQQWAG